MSDNAVPGSRRLRKKKQVVVNKKTLIYVIFQISILSIILLFPVFSQSVLAHTNTLFALGTLFSFGGIIVYLSIRLMMTISDWMGRGKHVRVVDGDMPTKERLFLRGLGGAVMMAIWAFILHLLHPFFVTMVWYQGYQLMEGNDFSLGEVAGTTQMIEWVVYFGIILFLLLLSRSYWSWGRIRGNKSDLPAE